MMSRFRESFWESDRSLRTSYIYTVKHKKIPFTDPLRIRPDLLEHGGVMQILWSHLGHYKKRTFRDLEPRSNFPEDGPEVQAYKQRKYIESIDGRPLWGLEIGVRYVSVTHPPSPSVADRRITDLWRKSHTSLQQYPDDPRCRGTLYWTLLGMLLSGGPEKYMEATDFSYKMWEHVGDDDPGLGWYPRANEDSDLIEEFWGESR